MGKRGAYKARSRGVFLLVSMIFLALLMFFLNTEQANAQTGCCGNIGVVGDSSFCTGWGEHNIDDCCPEASDATYYGTEGYPLDKNDCETQYWNEGICPDDLPDICSEDEKGCCCTTNPDAAETGIYYEQCVTNADYFSFDKNKDTQEDCNSFCGIDNPVYQCNDGIDNDGDGYTDYPDDPDCDSPEDDRELTDTETDCDNSIDDDYDTLTDCEDDDCSDDPACVTTVECSSYTQNECQNYPDECKWCDIDGCIESTDSCTDCEQYQEEDNCKTNLCNWCNEHNSCVTFCTDCEPNMVPSENVCVVPSGGGCDSNNECTQNNFCDDTTFPGTIVCQCDEGYFDSDCTYSGDNIDEGKSGCVQPDPCTGTTICGDGTCNGDETGETCNTDCPVNCEDTGFLCCPLGTVCKDSSVIYSNLDPADSCNSEDGNCYKCDTCVSQYENSLDGGCDNSIDDDDDSLIDCQDFECDQEEVSSQQTRGGETYTYIDDNNKIRCCSNPALLGNVDDEGIFHSCGDSSACSDGAEIELEQSIDYTEGKKKLALSWTLNGADCSANYDLYMASVAEEGSCPENIEYYGDPKKTELTALTNTITDFSAETYYCFKVKANFNDGSYVISDSLGTSYSGDSICLSKTGPFCQSGEMKKCKRPDNIDGYNLKNDDECSNGCFTDSNGYAQCFSSEEVNEGDICDACNSPLGMFGTALRKLSTPVDSTNPIVQVLYNLFGETTQCSDIPFCYEDNTLTTNNKFDSCDKVSKCSDYNKESSCMDNKCIDETTCEWKDIYEELGFGVCVDENPEKRDCGVCGKRKYEGQDYNPSLDFCTQEYCDAISGDEKACYFDGEDCVNTRDMGCVDYSDKKSCVDNNDDDQETPVDVDIQKEQTGTYGTNSIIQESDDYIPIGLCKWKEEIKCFKDADNDDSKDEKEHYLKRTDFYPPETTILLPEGKNHDQTGRITLNSLEEIKIYGKDLGKEKNACSDTEKYCSGLNRMHIGFYDSETNGEIVYNSANTEHYPKHEILKTTCAGEDYNLCDEAFNNRLASWETGVLGLTHYGDDFLHNLEVVKNDTIIVYDKKIPEITNWNIPQDEEGSLISVQSDPEGKESGVTVSITADEPVKCKVEITDILTEPNDNNEYEDAVPVSDDAFLSDNGAYATGWAYVEGGFSKEKFEDGYYSAHIKCEDLAGNEFSDSKEFMVDGDIRINTPMPQNTIDHTTIRLSVKTISAAQFCKYELKHPAQSNSDNNFPDPEDTGEGYLWTKDIDLVNDYGISNTEQGYLFLVTCKMNDPEGSEPTQQIFFSVDKSPPEATAWRVKGEEALTGGYWTNYGMTATLECNDLPGTYNFGCEKFFYCTGEEDCETTTEAEIGEDNKYSSSIDLPEYSHHFCYSAKEKTKTNNPKRSLLFPEDHEFGGKISEKKCVHILVDRQAPELIIDELSADSSDIFLTADNNYTLKGKIIDWQTHYDTDFTGTTDKTYKDVFLEANITRNGARYADITLRESGTNKAGIRVSWEVNNQKATLYENNPSNVKATITNIDFSKESISLTARIDTQNQFTAFIDGKQIGPVSISAEPEGTVSISSQDGTSESSLKDLKIRDFDDLADNTLTIVDDGQETVMPGLGDEQFTTYVSLAENGIKEIKILGKDKAGNGHFSRFREASENTETYYIYHDTEAPHVETISVDDLVHTNGNINPDDTNTIQVEYGMPLKFIVNIKESTADTENVHGEVSNANIITPKYSMSLEFNESDGKTREDGTWTVTLGEDHEIGTLNFSITSYDKFGHSREEAFNDRIFVVDTIDPELELDDPDLPSFPKGWVSDSQAIRVKGEYSDRTARKLNITITSEDGRTNSIEKPAEASDSIIQFDEPALLFEGKNTLTVWIEDVAGHRIEKTKENIYYDNSPPSLAGVEIKETGERGRGPPLCTDDVCNTIELGRNISFRATAEDPEYTDTISSSSLSVIGPDNSQIYLIEQFTDNIAMINVSTEKIGEYSFIITITDGIGLINESITYSVDVEDRTPPLITTEIYDDNGNPTRTLTTGNGERKFYNVSIKSDEPINIDVFGYHIPSECITEYVSYHHDDDGDYRTEWNASFYLNNGDPCIEGKDADAEFILAGIDGHGTEFDSRTTVPEVFDSGNNTFHVDTLGSDQAPIFYSSQPFVTEDPRYTNNPEFNAYGTTPEGTTEARTIYGTSSDQLTEVQSTAPAMPNELKDFATAVYSAETGDTEVKVEGDHSLYFNNGYYLFVETGHKSDFLLYTILSSSYDPSSGMTTITISEPLDKGIDEGTEIEAYRYESPDWWFVFSKQFTTAIEELFFRTRAIDAEGNLGKNSLIYHLFYDSMSPEMTSTEPADRSKTGDVIDKIKAFFHDAGSGFDCSSLSYSVIRADLDNLSNINSSCNSTTCISEPSCTEGAEDMTAILSYALFDQDGKEGMDNGYYSVNISVKDLAGNSVKESFSFTINGNMPNSPYVFINNSNTYDGKIYTSEPLPEMIISYSKDATYIVISQVQKNPDQAMSIFCGEGHQGSSETEACTRYDGTLDNSPLNNYTFIITYGSELEEGRTHHHTIIAKKMLETGEYGPEGSYDVEVITDRTPPNVTIDPLEYVKNRTIKVTGAYTDKNIRKIYMKENYRTGGGSERENSTPMEITKIIPGSSEAGTWETNITLNSIVNENKTVIVWATDKAGNIGEEKREIFFLDNIAPSITCSYDNSGVWVNGDVNISLTADDSSGSGIKEIRYCEGESCNPDSGIITDGKITLAGKHGNIKIKGKAWDKAENPSEEASCSALIDNEVPETTATFTLEDGTAYSEGEWTSQKVTATLDNNDCNLDSGCEYTRFCLEEGCEPDTPYAGPITINESVTFRYRSKDNAGNTEEIKEGRINIDRTSPVLSNITITNSNIIYDALTHTYYTSEENINITGILDDNGTIMINMTGSCLRYLAFEARKDVLFRARVCLGAEGMTGRYHTINITAEDKVGNKAITGEDASAIIIFDDKSPNVTITSMEKDREGRFYTQYTMPSISFSTDEKADCNVSYLPQGLSTLFTEEAVPMNASQTAHEVALSAPLRNQQGADTENTLSFICEDFLGNTEPERQRTIVMDKTNPEIIEYAATNAIMTNATNESKAFLVIESPYTEIKISDATEDVRCRYGTDPSFENMNLMDVGTENEFSKTHTSQSIQLNDLSQYTYFIQCEDRSLRKTPVKGISITVNLSQEISILNMSPSGPIFSTTSAVLEAVTLRQASCTITDAQEGSQTLGQYIGQTLTHDGTTDYNGMTAYREIKQLTGLGESSTFLFTIECEDPAGIYNTSTRTTTFTTVPELSISLEAPSLGVSRSVPYDISVKTSRNAECRYDLLQYPLYFDIQESFNESNGIIHTVKGITHTNTKIHVSCKDSFGYEKTASYNIKVDGNRPSITRAYAFPTPIVYTINNKIKTSLNVLTNKEAVCRYSIYSAKTNYSEMEEEFSPFDEDNISAYSKSHTKEIILNENNQEYRYSTSCKSLNGMVSETSFIDFRTSIGAELDGFFTSPQQTWYSQTQFDLNITLNKPSTCIYGLNESDMQPTGSGTSLNHYKEDAFSVQDDGTHTLYLRCSYSPAQSTEEEIKDFQISFGVDTTNPTEPNITHDEKTYMTDRLHASWTADDDGSGIAYYTIAIGTTSAKQDVVNWTTIGDETSRTEYGLNLTDGQKYYWFVKATDNVGNEGRAGVSSGIKIDTSLIPVNTTPTCTDNIQNGFETGVDCGGSECPKCGLESSCDTDNDCESGNCDNSTCKPDKCHNSILDTDNGETDVDCGGACGPCSNGKDCDTNSDCASLYCNDNNKCESSSCSDGRKNGHETGVDCGGSCDACKEGEDCLEDSDCESGVCGMDNRCKSSSCDDNIRNGNETGVDCGGSCDGCEEGTFCREDSDCLSNKCTEGICEKKEGGDNGDFVDTDGDGIPDDWEIANGLDPTDPTDAELDFDDDQLTNYEEWEQGTEPYMADSDGDSFDDALELYDGYNPLDPNSHPSTTSFLSLLLLILAILGLLGGGGFVAYKELYQKNRKGPGEGLYSGSGNMQKRPGSLRRPGSLGRRPGIYNNHQQGNAGRTKPFSSSAVKMVIKRPVQTGNQKMRVTESNEGVVNRAVKGIKEEADNTITTDAKITGTKGNKDWNTQNAEKDSKKDANEVLEKLSGFIKSDDVFKELEKATMNNSRNKDKTNKKDNNNQNNNNQKNNNKQNNNKNNNTNKEGNSKEESKGKGGNKSNKSNNKKSTTGKQNIFKELDSMAKSGLSLKEDNTKEDNTRAGKARKRK